MKKAVPDASGRLVSCSVVSTPDWIRTSNLRFRRPMLYPIELRVLIHLVEWPYRIEPAGWWQVSAVSSSRNGFAPM